MKLIEEFTIAAQLEEPLSIGAVPTGERVYFGHLEMNEAVQGAIANGTGTE